MRPIKFRGKRVDNGEWVYGYYMCRVNCEHKIYTGKLITLYKVVSPSNQKLVDQVFEVLPETVGQFTGLKDSKGVEIYEADIVKFIKGIHEEGCGCEHCYPVRFGDVAGVKWVDDGFVVLPMKSYFNGNGARKRFCKMCSIIGRLMTPNHEIPLGFFVEVIGNIYDNKDLLT